MTTPLSKASRRAAEELANAGAIQQASVSGIAWVIDAAMTRAVEREQTRIETWLRQQGGSGPFFADALVALRAPAKEVP